jgi:hypothetical protein
MTDGPHERRWQCIHNCATFATIGIPSRCPHCGSSEVRADGVQIITTLSDMDITYYNDNERNRSGE